MSWARFDPSDPAIVITSRGQMRLNPAAQSLAMIEKGDRVALYYDPEQDGVAVRLTTEGAGGFTAAVTGAPRGCRDFPEGWVEIDPAADFLRHAGVDPGRYGASLVTSPIEGLDLVGFRKDRMPIRRRQPTPGAWS
jgi:hypothetical protein